MLIAFEVLDARGEPVALAAAGIGRLSSLAYWQLRDRPLQHLLSFVGLAVSVGATIAWVGGESTGAAIGAALWSLGVTRAATSASPDWAIARRPRPV